MPSSITSRFQKAKAKGVKRRKVMPKMAIKNISVDTARRIVSKGSELKVIDFPYTGINAMSAIPSLSATSTGVRVTNLITQGAGLSQRTGTKCLLKNSTARIIFDCTMTPGASGYIYPNYVRILCVWWPDGNTVPSLNQIVSTMVGDNSQVDNKRAGKAINSQDANADFRILVDDTIEFNFGGNGTGTGKQVMINTKKCIRF